jgi:hypothetical protein
VVENDIFQIEMSFSTIPFTNGYQNISMEKCIVCTNGFRIVSLERAVLEGLKLSTKIGERNAIKAARDALANRRTNVLKLGKCAQELGLEKVLQKYIEVIAP